jgi:DNA polymerase-3 subunit delta'
MSMQLGSLGQPRVQAILRDMFARHRVSGSFLFDGPAGVGKSALAIELGRLLNCGREGSCEPRGLFLDPPQVEDGDACSSCRRFRALQHPDLHVVFPVPSGFRDAASDQDTKLATDFRQREPRSMVEVLRGKAADPYHKPMFERPVGIQADVLRDVVLPVVQRKPVEARTKVVVLSDADQMAFGIGNLLLKTLEEPPADCLLVLTSSVPERLLPTMRSRCQRLTFAPLAVEWMVPRLEILHGVAATDARLAASLAQGSMLAAGRHLGGVFDEVRDRAFAIMRAAADCDVFELLQLATTTARGWSKQRQLFPLLLQLIALAARDTLMLVEGVGEQDVALVNQDRATELRGLARAFGSEGLRRIIPAAEQAERQIAGYVHTELTLSSLFLGLTRESDRARAMLAREA